MTLKIKNRGCEIVEKVLRI